MNTKLKNKLAVLTLSCASILATNNIANAVTIDITGTVVASPCTVNGGDNTLDISLGDNIQADELATPGNTTNWKNFSLKLTNCPPSTTSFSVAFAGTADSDDANFYANTGTATNLKLALTSQDGNTTFNNGSSLENVLIDASSHAYNLNLRTRAESKGLVMPGTIKGQVQATFTYQ